MKKTKLRIINLFAYISEFGIIGTFQLIYQRLKKEKIVKISIRGYKNPFYFRANSSDFYMLRNVIGKKEMIFTKKKIKPSLIIDAGANVGYATRALINQYPHSKIIAIEPDIKNCEIFNQNIDEIKNSSQIILHQAALWSTKTSLAIINPDDEFASFQVAEVPYSIGETGILKVSTITIPELVNNYGYIDILKMDIEGSEYEIFNADVSLWIKNIGIIIVELHERKMPGLQKIVQEKIHPYCHNIYYNGEYTVLDIKGLLK